MKKQHEFDYLKNIIKEVSSDFDFLERYEDIKNIPNIESILKWREYQFSFELSFGSSERDYLNIYFICFKHKIEILSASIFKSSESIPIILEAIKQLAINESKILNS